MRIAVYAVLAWMCLAVQPTCAQSYRAAARFWKDVQAVCDATAAAPARDVGRRIAKTAIDEFEAFGGHRIDSNGRLFSFGLTEAQQGKDDGDSGPASFGQLGWWRVMTYWRALYGNDVADKLEVLGYRDASTGTEQAHVAPLLRATAGQLLRAADDASDARVREVLREAALRAAIIDTPWSAAFVSYAIRQAGVPADAFPFANAHRAYIYAAFATSAAELTGTGGSALYRACPLATTRPRVGDLICEQREPALADTSAEAVRERIRIDLAGGTGAHSVQRTHCEIVAHIDRRARKVYSIGGNDQQGVAAKKLNLRGRRQTLSAAQGRCDGPARWALPDHPDDRPGARGLPRRCSLNDKNWFVLLQVR